jgi:hypothetical protein
MGKLSMVGAFIVILTWQSLTIDSAQLRSKHNDCVEQIGNLAHKRECWLREAMQNWTYVNSTLKNQGSGKCLTAGFRMSNCNPTPEEIKKWGKSGLPELKMLNFYDDIRFNVTADGMVTYDRYNEYCIALNSKRDETQTLKCDKKNKDIVQYIK